MLLHGASAGPVLPVSPRPPPCPHAGSRSGSSRSPGSGLRLCQEVRSRPAVHPRGAATAGGCCARPAQPGSNSFPRQKTKDGHKRKCRGGRKNFWALFDQRRY